jgi:hypothetical protein
MKTKKRIKAKVITGQNIYAEISPGLSYERDMLEFLNLERIAKEKGEDMIGFYVRQLFLLHLHQFYKDHELILTDDEKLFEARECPNCKVVYVCRKTSTRVYCSDRCQQENTHKRSYLKYQLDYDAYCAYMQRNSREKGIMSIKSFIQKLRKDGERFWEIKLNDDEGSSGK